jgi:hypothetical protein
LLYIHPVPKDKLAMPLIKYAHICEFARVDAGGTVTIVGIFDAIHAISVPVQFPLMHVITNLFGNKGEEFTFSTRIAAPDGSFVRVVQPVRIRFEQDNSRMSQINGYLGSVFPVFGEYSVEIVLDDIVIHSLPFLVVQRT